MSRQSKNATNRARAKEITRMHLAGEKGPSKTQAVHGKKHTYRNNPEIAKRIAEQTKLQAEKEKSALERVLKGAGAAAE